MGGGFHSLSAEIMPVLKMANLGGFSGGALAICTDRCCILQPAVLPHCKAAKAPGSAAIGIQLLNLGVFFIVSRIWHRGC